MTLSGDCALRCQALEAQRAKISKTSKDFNLPPSQKKEKKEKKRADLCNVNCHLTSPPPPSAPPPRPLPGSCSRSGVESELNQGFSCYKSPSTPGGEWQRQADRNKRPRNGSGSLFSGELKPDCCCCCCCSRNYYENRQIEEGTTTFRCFQLWKSHVT